MIISQEYDRSYEPAMPVLTIGLSASGIETPAIQLTALIDSGADGTMLPRSLLKQAGAWFAQQRLMRGVIGKPVTVDLYLTAVTIHNHTIHGIRAVALDDTQEAIIGRDVLNQLNVTLNGLAHIVEVR